MEVNKDETEKQVGELRERERRGREENKTVKRKKG